METNILANLALHKYAIALAIYTCPSQLSMCPGSWIVPSIAAVLAVISVAVLVYMLAGIIGSGSARQWARFQIYEALLSIVLIVAFGSLAFILVLNPVPAFTAINLYSAGSCTSAATTTLGCTAPTTIYSLAAFDLAQFNSDTFTVAQYVFYADFLSSAISGFEVKPGVQPIVGLPTVNVTIDLSALYPSGLDQLLKFSYEGLLLATLVNQLQLMLISSAIFLLGFFLTVGLVARTLGVTRTFGGAMIAFGLGVGIVYPLLTAITYGYITFQLNSICIISSTGAVSTIASCGSSIVYEVLEVLFIYPVTAYGSTAAGVTFASFLTQTGYIILGCTVVPVLNIAIVDAFITDFSKAIGEKMTFATLFGSLI
jgi:hypothetical protein